ncbi:MAG: chitobiase/beta-hexosaminidase C-terminal domain-containing protein [Planctomycetota bacterium]
MRRLILIVLIGLCTPAEGQQSNYQVDDTYRIDGAYRGRFTPPAEYVLSGRFADDMAPLPDVLWQYRTESEGYRQDVMSKVPPPGVHPRVLMGIEDIERIREKIRLGEDAPRYFRILLNWALNQRPDLVSRSFMALVMEDEEAGRKCVDELIALATEQEPMIDLLNHHPVFAGIRDNYYYWCRSEIVSVGGVPYKKAFREGGAERIHELARLSVETNAEHHFQVLPDTSGHVKANDYYAYDYLHGFMTEPEREFIRSILKKITYGRYTSGMDMPGHWFINNHMSMSYDLVLAALCLEGQEGYDERVVREAAKALQNQLTYYISGGGLLYEKKKGFVPERPLLAITRRLEYPLLSHEHLYKMVMAKAMDSVNVFWRYNELRNHQTIANFGEGFQEPRLWYMGFASGPWMDSFFNVAFIMKFVYPDDPIVDYYYKSRMQTQGLGPPDGEGPLPAPRIRYSFPEVCLLTAVDGFKDRDGAVVNYDKTGLPEELTQRNEPWVDMKRGVVQARSSWDKDALMVHYEARSDIYAAGHEGPEAGDFSLYANGIEWSGWRKWYLDSYFRNAVLIDGKAGIYSPTAAKLMEVSNTPHGVTMVSDNTDQYNWRKWEKNMHLWAGVNKEALDGYLYTGYTSEHMARDWEIPFQPHMREYIEGFASLDWGNWHGETRGTEMYGRWNDIDHAFRTLHLAKGDPALNDGKGYPYLLVVDDIRKDDKQRQYDWVMQLADDIALWKGEAGVGTRDKGIEERKTNQTDLYLCSAETPFVTKRRGLPAVNRRVKTGDPVLLVRVLHRNTAFSFPQPAYEANYSHPRIKVPATAVDPEFRIMLYPHRHGDPIPLTAWNEDRSKLTVMIDRQIDVYDFAKTDGERSTMAVTRKDEQHQIIPAGPAAPELVSSLGWQPDWNAEDEVREISFNETSYATLNLPPLTQAYRYTLDGSEPTEDSTLYTGPVAISQSLVFKAKAFADVWPFADSNASQTLTIQYTKETPAEAVQLPAGTVAGLTCKVFEVHHTIFDEKNGIFSGRKNMLPSLTDRKPLATFLTEAADIPLVIERDLPKTEMANGYYAFRGFFKATTTGDYAFRLNSCGPVHLSVAGKPMIDVTLPYGLSQKDRFGQVSLQEGWHAFALTVTDPIFWKAGDAEPYEITLDAMMPGDVDYRPIEAGKFITVEPSDAKKIEAEETAFSSQAVSVSQAEPGLVAEWFAEGATQPSLVELTPVLIDDPIEDKALRFHGFLKIREPGFYTFITDGGGENELNIGGATVCKVEPGSTVDQGGIELDAGMHPFSLTVMRGESSTKIITPKRSEAEKIPASFFWHNPDDAEISHDLNYGLIIHLPFNELVNQTLSLATGEGATATGFNGQIVDDPERGKVYQPGYLNYTEYAKKYDLHIADIPRNRYERSIAFWFKPMNKRGRYTLLRGRHLRHVHFNRFALDRGKLGMHASPGNSPNLTSDIKFGEWNHLALVHQNGMNRWYLNGEFVAIAIDTNSTYKDLFAFSGDDDIFFDELKIYDRPLSPSEVTLLAND